MKPWATRSVSSACALALAASFVAPAFATGAQAPIGVDPRQTKALRAAACAGVSVAETPDVGGTLASSAELGVSPVAGTLDVLADAVDVYWVDLEVGQRIGVTLAGDVGLNADAYLYAPGTTDIVLTSALAGTVGDAFVKSFEYRVASSGRYYVAVAASSGAGSYTLSWYAQYWNSDGDSEIPGAAGVSPTIGTVAQETDPDDVFRFGVTEGERLTVSLDSWDPSLTPALYVFPPGTTSVLTGVPVGVSSGGSQRSVTYDVPAGSGKAGTYYVDVRALAGSGGYDLRVATSAIPADVWKNIGSAVSLPASPVSAALDGASTANIVYRVTLAAGDRLDLRLASPDGADFDVYVYPPSTSNIFGVAPVAWADDSVGVDAVTFDAKVAGTYYVEVRRFAGAGAFALQWLKGRTPIRGEVERLWGADRYQTAIEISKKTFAGGSCPTVVLATGADFPDALAASGLAGVYGSPVLLTPKAALPAGLTAELVRLGANKVVIVGGPAAVSADVESALKLAGYAVDRAQGATRYETAADVARKIRAITGARADSPAFVVRGDLFPDALAAAPLAYRGAYPVLLTSSTALSPATAAVITETGVNEIIIAGGAGAVGPGVEASLAAVAGVRTVHRESGDDRYETAAKLARYGVRMWWAENTYIGVATGVNFPDALGGGAAAGSKGGVILLTRTDVLPTPTSGYLQTYKAEVLSPKVYGGTLAVTDSVKAAIDSALR